jgi:hypothetical protein
MRNAYSSLELLLPCEHVKMTKKQARANLDLLLSQREARTKIVTRFLKDEAGLTLSTDSSLEDLDVLPGAIAKLAGTIPVKREDQSQTLNQFPVAFRSFLKTMLPKRELSDDTLTLCLDCGLLWGEVFCTRYIDAKWAVGKPPKSSIDYNQPIIVGVDLEGMEFNPIWEMTTWVQSEIERDASRFTVADISAIRAWELGLDDDPQGLNPSRRPH